MTYDPAFMNTAACRSRITFIDGDKGILLYRGYPIEQLAEHSDFLETVLPDPVRRAAHGAAARGLDRATSTCTRCSTRTSRSSSRGSATTRTRWACSSARSARSRPSIPTPRTSSTPESRRLQMIRLIAKVPGIAAYAYRHNIGRPYVLPGQRAELLRQFPQHAVQDDRAALQAAPGARTRARRALHPARRPRAELQHERDAQHRQLARRSVLGAGRRRGGPLRPAPRRRQRGGAADARARLARCRTSRPSSSGSRPAKAG